MFHLWEEIRTFVGCTLEELIYQEMSEVAFNSFLEAYWGIIRNRESLSCQELSEVIMDNLWSEGFHLGYFLDFTQINYYLIISHITSAFGTTQLP